MEMYDIGTTDELWDSDLGPAMQEALNLNPDTDMNEWFMEREIKMPGVIYHDKLISDALLGQTPIKSEHSYSLNSDGDSIPDSPRSLQNKIDDADIDDDCFDITMSTALPTKPAAVPSTALKFNNNDSTLLNNNVAAANNLLKTSISGCTLTTSFSAATTSNTSSNSCHGISLGTNQTTFKYLNNIISNQRISNICNSNAVTANCQPENDVDESSVKEEPMSPGSSCPPSPSTSAATLLIGTTSPNSQGPPPQYGSINVNLANMAAYTNTDLVFEHNKNGSLQLSSASQSLLKNQQIILNGTQQRLVVPKLNIRMETQTQGFGLPPTPPSSLSSDDSEGNQSPEHCNSAMSPNVQQQLLQNQSASISPNSRRALSMQQSSHSNASSNGGTANSAPSSSASSRGYSGSSSRQPIHTPLISSQPRGSTGQLELTEEEKRTLIAEGYPIPTKLPLTKTEEKSLKKIRRKIKNKISAQESRRKKKEYMDKLERQVEILVNENTSFRKKVETLEDTNANLMSQLAKLQALVNRQNVKKA